MSTFGEKLIESAKQAKEHAASHLRLRTVIIKVQSSPPKNSPCMETLESGRKQICLTAEHSSVKQGE